MIPALRVVAGSAWHADSPPPDVRQEWLDVGGRLVAWGGVADGRYVMVWPGLGTYRFGSTGDVEVFPAPAADPAALQDSFVRGVVPVVLIGRGYEALHASAIATPAGVVAFTAVSGTGKSSLALGLAARGYTQWADDTVVFDASGAQPLAIALPFPARVDEPVRLALGSAAGRTPQVAAGTSAPLARIYVIARDPSLDPNRPLFASLPAARVFEHVLAHAHPFDLDGPERRRQMLLGLMRLASGVPGWQLTFAPSLDAMDVLLDALVRHIEAG